MTLDEAIQHSKEVAKKERDKLLKVGDEYICYECGKEHEQLAGWLEELKEYKQLEEQGLLLKLPCKVGDTVWEVQKIRKRIQQYEIISVNQGRMGYLYFNWELKDGYGYYGNLKGFGTSDFNKTVFLTKEEAEQELKRTEGEE